MRHAKTEEIERQLEHDRFEIGNTIEAIQHRLSPGQLLDQALGYARNGGSQAASALGRSASQNPWPLILTGVGLAWLMQSTAASRNGNGHADYRSRHYQTSPEEARRSEAIARARAAGAAIRRQSEETEERFRERVTEARARAVELKRQAGETAEAFRHRVDSYIQRAEDTASELRHRARSAMSRSAEALGDGSRAVQERAHDAQARAREFYASEPLIVGAIGVAIGTLLGALLPATETENRLLGEYGGRVRHKAADVASEAAERSKIAAAEGVRAAARAAEEVARGGTDHSAGEPARHS